MNNYEIIKKMNPEELAEFITRARARWTCLPGTDPEHKCNYSSNQEPCKVCWAEWLQKEVKE